jgi:hypothetical protein
LTGEFKNFAFPGIADKDARIQDGFELYREAATTCGRNHLTVFSDDSHDRMLVLQRAGEFSKCMTVPIPDRVRARQPSGSLKWSGNQSTAGYGP